ncbi:hypothetical protein EON65_28070 [archaeon]|nr:MAG: hypothetical protein EON65_28070 [archaeon]
MSKQDVLIEVDFEGEDAITYWDIKNTFGSREPSVEFTRVIFAAHAEKMREAIRSRGGEEGSTEEEVNELLRQVMEL